MQNWSLFDNKVNIDKQVQIISQYLEKIDELALNISSSKKNCVAKLIETMQCNTMKKYIYIIIKD